MPIAELKKESQDLPAPATLDTFDRESEETRKAQGYYDMPESVVGMQKWFSLVDKKSRSLLRSVECWHAVSARRVAGAHSVAKAHGLRAGSRRKCCVKGSVTERRATVKSALARATTAG